MGILSSEMFEDVCSIIENTLAKYGKRTSLDIIKNRFGASDVRWEIEDRGDHIVTHFPEYCTIRAEMKETSITIYTKRGRRGYGGDWYPIIDICGEFLEETQPMDEHDVRCYPDYVNSSCFTFDFISEIFKLIKELFKNTKWTSRFNIAYFRKFVDTMVDYAEQHLPHLKPDSPFFDVNQPDIQCRVWRNEYGKAVLKVRLLPHAIHVYTGNFRPKTHSTTHIILDETGVHYINHSKSKTPLYISDDQIYYLYKYLTSVYGSSDSSDKNPENTKEETPMPVNDLSTISLYHPHVFPYDMDEIDQFKVMKKIETMGRICYLSESKGDPASFIRGIVKRGHLSVTEHASITMIFVVDRAIQLEMVRHRISSYSAQSTRYTKCTDFIMPINFYDPAKYGVDKMREFQQIWLDSCKQDLENYNALIDKGCKPEDARSILPNCLSSKIAVTKDIRAWIESLTLRCEKGAHPDMKMIMIPVLQYFKEKLPVFFENIQYDEEFYHQHLDNGRWKMYIKEDAE